MVALAAAVKEEEMVNLASSSSSSRRTNNQDNNAVASSSNNANNNNTTTLPSFSARFRAELNQFSWSRFVCNGAAAPLYYRQQHQHHGGGGFWDGDSCSFRLQDPGTNNRMIDVPASFCPTGFWVLVWKCIATLWSLSAIIWGTVYNARRGHWIKYYSFFSNWGTVISFFYMVCSLVNSVSETRRRCRQSESNKATTVGASQSNHNPSRMIRLTWALFVMTAHSEVSIMMAFWTFMICFVPSEEFRHPNWDLAKEHYYYYHDIMTHLGVGLLMLVDGLYVNRIPIRLAHCWQFVIWLYLLYVLWMPFYAALSPDKVFYQDGMKMNGPVFKAITQETPPVIIYAVLLLHGVAAILILVYGFVVRRRIPARLATFGKCVVCCDLIYMMWTALYETLGPELVLGALAVVIPTLLLLLVWCPLVHVLLYAMSLWSPYWNFSGRNRRYLPMTTSTSTEDDDVDDDFFNDKQLEQDGSKDGFLDDKADDDSKLGLMS